MKKDIEISAKKLYKRKLIKRLVKIFLLVLILFISILYIGLYVVYQSGRFTVTLDKNLSNRKNIFLSETNDFNSKTRELSADTIDYMDNISVDWLPSNIDDEANGSHNGDNYVAYTFYVLNSGKETVHYWYEIDIDDTVKDLDKAIRVMVIHNGVKTIYAKESSDGSAEDGTIKFTSNSVAILQERKDFTPNTSDKFTVVFWIEGDDPDCNNDLLGGEIKMHMDITEEHIKESNKK